MSWLALSLFLTLGYYPMGGVNTYEPPGQFVDYTNEFYQQFDIRAEVFGVMAFGGKVRIEDWLNKPDAGIGFWPNALISTFYVEASLGSVTVGWRQDCIHPVMPFQARLGYDSLIDAARDEVYLRIGGKIGVGN